MDSDTKDTTERDLRVLGERFVTQFNMLVDRLERATTTEELLAFRALPTIERLESIEAYARSLTRGEPWIHAPGRERQMMAEVRCLVSDAVWCPRQLDYPSATTCVRLACEKLFQIKDRKRTVLPMPIQEAIGEAAEVLLEVMTLFMEAESSMGVRDGDSSHAR